MSKFEARLVRNVCFVFVVFMTITRLDPVEQWAGWMSKIHRKSDKLYDKQKSKQKTKCSCHSLPPVTGQWSRHQQPGSK